MQNQPITKASSFVSKITTPETSAEESDKSFFDGNVNLTGKIFSLAIANLAKISIGNLAIN
nr:hypothetical protein [Vibrio cholerae]